jgi:pimeloyl-ACP methyl ester carboxylesterase
MAEARLRHLSGLSKSGFHKLAYRDYGAPEEVPVVCLHGLGRNARDFDRLADALVEAGRRVVCLDVVGRGESGWLRDPMDYGYPQYMADAAALIARLDCREVDIVGTSMGGLIGMMLAALPDNPLRRLVINDVGPFIPKAALERILAYFGQDPSFADLAAAEAYHRETYRSFGDLTDADWRHMTETSLRRDDGAWHLHYDPRIALPMKAIELADVDLWAVWEQIKEPVLVLRGAESDLLPAEVAVEMTRRGPRAGLIEFAGCGHAPALLSEEQIRPVVEWLSVA